MKRKYSSVALVLAAMMCFSTTVHAEEMGGSYSETVSETSNESVSEDVNTNKDADLEDVKKDTETKESNDTKEVKETKEADKTAETATNEKTANDKTAETAANEKAASDKTSDTAANDKTADAGTNEKTANDKTSDTAANEKTAAATANEKAANDKTADAAANNTGDPAANNNTGNAATNEIAAKIPDEVNSYAENNYRDLLEASISYYPELESTNVDAYKLQPGYVIYDGDETEPEIYYYPVSLNDEIVMVLSVVNTSEGLTISGSEEMVDGLNEINYESNSNNIVFYEDGDAINAENEKGKFLVEEIADDSDEKTAVNNDFASLELDKKIDVVAESAETKGVLDIDQIQRIAEEDPIVEYSPAFEKNSKTNQTCKLYNRQPQGFKPICWAAAVATIVNYRFGKNITAKSICDEMNWGYKGANSNTQQKALKNHKLKYNIHLQLSEDSIKKNLKYKYPILANAYTSTGAGHAVTVYGWDKPGKTMYVTIWNSGIKGKGDIQTVQYMKKGSTFRYAGKTWAWSRSLSYY